MANENEIDAKPEESDTVSPKTVEGSGELLDFPRPSGKDWKRDTEPAKDAPKRRGRPPGKVRPKLKDAITSQLVLVGLGVSAWNPYDGQVIIANAGKTAKALEQLAEENDSVKRALEMALTASAWSQVLIAVASMAVPIAANHGLAPTHLVPLFGAPLPDVEGKAERKEDGPRSVGDALSAL